jgi:hypothetical protein
VLQSYLLFFKSCSLANGAAEVPPFGLPLCVHAYRFHVQTIRPESAFATYLVRLVAACQASQHAAAARLLSHASEPFGGSTKGILRSLVLVIVGEPGRPVTEALHALLRADSSGEGGEGDAAGGGRGGRGSGGGNIEDAIVAAAARNDHRVRELWRGIVDAADALAPPLPLLRLLHACADAAQPLQEGHVVWPFFLRVLEDRATVAAAPLLVLRTFKAFYKALLEAYRAPLLSALPRWGGGLLPYVDWAGSEGIPPGDVHKVRKYAGVLLANGLVAALQGRHFGAQHATDVIAGGRALLTRDQPPLEPNLKQVLIVVLADIAPRSSSEIMRGKGFTSNAAICVADESPSNPAPSRKQAAWELQLAALEAAEADEASLNEATKERRRFSIRPASSLSSSSLSSTSLSSATPTEMRTHGEGEFVKVSAGEKYVGGACKGCSDAIDAGNFVIVKGKDLFQPCVSMCC